MLVRLNEKHPFMIFLKACSRSNFLWNLKGPEPEIMDHKCWILEEKYLLEQADCSCSQFSVVASRYSWTSVSVDKAA